jgi:hypothetical protein
VVPSRLRAKGINSSKRWNTGQDFQVSLNGKHAQEQTVDTKRITEKNADEQVRKTPSCLGEKPCQLEQDNSPTLTDSIKEL